MLSQNTLQKYVYDIAVFANGQCHFYSLFCLNHREALVTALAIGLPSNPIPVGGRCLVSGPCREPNCECGEISTLECEKVAEEDCSLTN